MIGDRSTLCGAGGTLRDEDSARYLATQLAGIRAEMAAQRTEFRRELAAQREEFRAELYRLRRREDQTLLRASSHQLAREARRTTWLIGLGIPVTIGLSILLGHSL
jgi:hypothetical protein